jgi:hypothetical protein
MSFDPTLINMLAGLLVYPTMNSYDYKITFKIPLKREL